MSEARAWVAWSAFWAMPHVLVCRTCGSRSPVLLKLFIFYENFRQIFPGIYFQQYMCQNRQKEDFAKNSVRFFRFISYLVIFQSKTISKVFGKIDVFWMHQQCSSNLAPLFMRIELQTLKHTI
jgi:hypothetical protein